jgi:hypothetical protein
VTEPPLALSFFDPAHRLHGQARAGAAIVFEGKTPSALPPPRIERDGDGYRAAVDDRLELGFAPVSQAAELAGDATRICRVTGRVGGRLIDCLGTATETLAPPAWAELDAVRSISALFDPDHALLVAARRPRSAGIELWLPGEEFPRRAFGTLIAGTSVQLDGLTVNAAVFDWRMEGREGSGGYDITARDEPPAAA